MLKKIIIITFSIFQINISANAIQLSEGFCEVIETSIENNSKLFLVLSNKTLNYDTTQELQDVLTRMQQLQMDLSYFSTTYKNLCE